ncbi:MAG TPA: tRNA uridine-5-carboxymethylaminomethyl(34) synthesis GTPase MnmE [Syntrophomonadaceae bacterium]|nr:tRNA uridine-5-carboxymethylaminomethyl(34) synthesis GTPase MnmE [Syntrophomonadaceae bacterium]HPR93962.1 tRNA uridine-5-carboxymethylaminomethyl(34) synthesis GTPase MnmE [Syntrophomonadaceae bacterium]
MFCDDIAAISTPPGEGGIAIVRLSGPEVITKIAVIFKPYQKEKNVSMQPGYTMHLGWLLDEKGDMIDEVLISIMKEPHSYTGENVVEINCHGGMLPARRCLEAVLEQKIRLAEPGEFTRRAFLNGRLDVNQAEAVIEIIRAKSEKALKLAIKQLYGHNTQQMKNLEEQLLGVIAQIQASIDFPDEAGEVNYIEVTNLLSELERSIENILLASQRAEVYRQGINIAIIGKPNVGKSSLLNALLKKNRAIVTDIPGTTRDIIEDYITIAGIPVKLIDTAGIRVTDDTVERLGVEKAEEVINSADLVIWMLDFVTGITEQDMEIFQRINGKKRIVLVNKEDLELNISEEELQNLFPGDIIIKASVKEETGLNDLTKCITDMALSGEVNQDNMEMMLNLRQKKAFSKAQRHINEARRVLADTPLECVAVDLGIALEALGELTGKNIKDEIIDRIFHDFCIGK